MVGSDSYRVIYWDASAIISVLFRDSHSDSARAMAQKEGFHLVSTLAYAETCAVIARLQRERVLAEVLIQAAFDVLRDGPWRHLTFLPDWEMVRSEARSVFCYWAVRELWVESTHMEKRLKMSQPGVAYAIGRGERIVKDNNFQMIE